MIQHSTVQCSTGIDRTGQYSTTQYNTVQCSTVQCSAAVECSAVRCGAVLLTVPHDTVHYNIVWLQYSIDSLLPGCFFLCLIPCVWSTPCVIYHLYPIIGAYYRLCIVYAPALPQTYHRSTRDLGKTYHSSAIDP